MDYSKQVWDHFRQPRYSGVFPPDESGVLSAAVGETLRGGVFCLQVQVSGQRISDVRQQVYGCGFLIASASWLADWLYGKTLVEASRFNKHLLEEALQLPPHKLHCAALAEQAVRNVLNCKVGTDEKGTCSDQ